MNGTLSLALIGVALFMIVAGCSPDAKSGTKEEVVTGTLHLRLAGADDGASVRESYHLETKEGRIAIHEVDLEGIGKKIGNPFNNGKEYRCTLARSEDGSCTLVKVVEK